MFVKIVVLFLAANSVYGQTTSSTTTKVGKTTAAVTKLTTPPTKTTTTKPITIPEGSDDSPTQVLQVNQSRGNLVCIIRHPIATSQICAGILVSGRVVLTSANCLYDRLGNIIDNPESYQIMFDSNINNYAAFGPRVEMISVHPLYNDYNRDNNIASLRLAQYVNEFPNKEEDSYLYEGPLYEDVVYDVVVFKKSNQTGETTVFIENRLGKVLALDECVSIYRNWGIALDTGHICVEIIGEAACYDGESAILLYKTSLVGILSFKLEVSKWTNKLPFIYTDVAKFRSFVANEVLMAPNMAALVLKKLSSILYIIILNFLIY